MFAPPVAAETLRHLTVVELFQSQGCSDCPPANANLIALSDRPDLLTLSFGVTYWDRLGWKDTFASPQFTARQWSYAHAFGRDEVFTPEVVVNGRADVVGANRAELEAIIDRESDEGGPPITYEQGVVGLGSGQGHAVVWLVRYDPHLVQVPIARGENGGRTLPHKDVVKQLVELGEWSGINSHYPVPPSPNAGWESAVLVERHANNEIIAAGRIPPL
jgi:hypothetical protein